MKTLNEFLTEYSKSHEDLTNQIIHILCVPPIFFSTVALFWMVPVGQLIPGVPAEYASLFNLATLGAIPVIGFYAALGSWALPSGIIWLAASYALCAAIAASSVALWVVAVPTFVIAWILQLYGHKVEGAKPSLVDDLSMSLIGPLFVQQKFGKLIRGESLAVSH